MRVRDWSSDVCSSDLDWVEREDVEVKRDPSAPRDAVRIMTVHGSKGLQAPLVVLADATKDPDRNGADHAMVAMADGALPLPLHCSPKEARGPVAEAFADAAERARQEHWRLAYVALTRAEDVLVRSEEHTAELQSLMRTSYAV